MDAWYYRISVACDTMEGEFFVFSLPSVWSTPLGLPGRCGMHAPTFNKWHHRKEKKKKKVTLHVFTHGAMRVWVDYFG